MITSKTFTLTCSDVITYSSNSFLLYFKKSSDPAYYPSILSKVVWWIEDPITSHKTFFQFNDGPN